MKRGVRSQRGLNSYHAGTAGEARVKAVLTDWNWQVGKPEPDMGVDCFAATTVFEGSASVTVAIQVKSVGVRCKAVSIAKKTAVRLRNQDSPVFLVAVKKPQSTCYWVALDPLLSAMSEEARSLRVSLVPTQTFSLEDSYCPEAFCAAIRTSKRQSVLRTLPRVSQYATEFELRCKEIDPRFGVRLEYSENTERYIIKAAESGVELRFTFRGSQSSEMQAYQDFLDWGSRAKLSGNLFMDDSDLLTHLGLSVPGSGVITIGANPWMAGAGLLRANSGPQIPVEVESHSGRKGTELSMRMVRGCVSINLRAPLPQNYPILVDAKLDIDSEALMKLCPKELHLIRSVSTIINALAESGSNFELRMVAHPQIVNPLHFGSSATEAPEVRELGFYIMALEALEFIYSELDISRDAKPLGNISVSHMHRWILVSEILKEGKALVKADSLSFHLKVEEKDVALCDRGDFRVETSLDVPFRGESLGLVPVDVYLKDYIASNSGALPEGCNVMFAAASNSSVAEMHRRIAVE